MDRRIEVMESTNAMSPIDYQKIIVPKYYYCSVSGCGNRGRQFRSREDNSASTNLYCLRCEREALGRANSVPAIPKPDGTSYYLCGEATEIASRWWRNLPSRSKKAIKQLQNI